MKQTWSLINESLKNCKKQSKPIEYIINNKCITDHSEIANAFNDYFINSGENMAKQIMSTASSFINYMPDEADSRLIFQHVDQEDIIATISSLKNKNSSGYDNISNKILKMICSEIAKPLSVIINQMFTTGIFPDSLKVAKIIPIFKSGDSNELSNYRPISLLTSFSKIFEKVIHKQLYDYLNENELLCPQQFGFRPNCSTELACATLTDHLLHQMDRMNIPINIYLDLSKAFDTLDHAILLKKMKTYGISAQNLSLFDSYLSNRKQYVVYDRGKSNFQTIKTGVPQGSVLGPLLFLIYINDFPRSSNIFNFLMYADDTTLYCNLNDIEEGNISLNNELNYITDWLACNKLSLNVNKTKFIVFHRKRKNIKYPSISINNMTLERVRTFNFLGLTLNEHLTWRDHLDNVSRKISRAIGVLNFLKHTYPVHILKTIYNTLILSQLNYCLLSWGANSDVVFGLQKKAMRVITCNHYKAHTNPIFKTLQLLKLQDLYKLKILKLYYNMVANNVPESIRILLPCQSYSRATYNIRNHSYQIPKIHHEYARNSLRYNLPKLINTTSNLIIEKIDTHSYFGFSLYTKNSFISSYNTDCNITNCFICTRNNT